MADKKQNIEHLRAEIPGAPGSALERTIYERRGIRDVAMEIFHDDQATVVAAALKGTAADRYSSLMEAADHWLKDAGELTFMEMIKAADKAKEREPETEHRAIDDFMFAVWAARVGEKRGYLSPEAIAARFISSSDYLHRRLGSDPELAKAVYAFADAYHWCHFEGHGEHELAALGLANARDRAAGPQKLRQQKEQKYQITKHVFQAFASDVENASALKGAKRVAGILLERINAALIALKYRPYSATSLEKAIRPLLIEHSKLPR